MAIPARTMPVNALKKGTPSSAPEVIAASKPMSAVVAATSTNRSLATEFEKTPLADRKAFIADLDKKRKNAEFGEQILFLIDRMEDIEKPVIVARLISAAATGKLPLSKALRVSKIVDRAFVEDLKTLPQFQAGSPTNRLIADALFSVGLLTGDGLAFFEGDTTARSGTTYHLNAYGQILVEYGLAQD
ncbi:hypothetical protein FJW07_30620 [Mesorhizobium sp. B3-1-9]|nr:hypothetical protein FJW07_30620 [Mesorhizobium sp. B3-1-9]